MKFVYHKNRDEIGVTFDYDSTEETCAVNFGSGYIMVSTNMLVLVDEVNLVTSYNSYHEQTKKMKEFVKTVI